MKTIMKTKNHFIFLLSAFIIISCGQTSSITEVNEDVKSEEVNEAVSAILTSYFDVKDALVVDDAEKTQAAAASMLEFTGQYADGLNEYLKIIAESKEIEVQRSSFETLTINLYALVKTNNTGTTIYKQYCPMAFDDKGAFWLSNEKQVLNPYFGASMLRCGRVEETIN
jgi:hypothetical protein